MTSAVRCCLFALTLVAGCSDDAPDDAQTADSALDDSAATDSSADSNVTDSSATDSSVTDSSVTDSSVTDSRATDSSADAATVDSTVDSASADTATDTAEAATDTATDTADAATDTAPIDPCSPLPSGLTTWTKTDSASVGTPDTYFLDVTPGDPFCATITGGGGGSWSVNVSNGTSSGLYCSGSSKCSIVVPPGQLTLLVTALTTDIGAYTLTVRYRPR